jgi:hypothetical protein
MLRQVIFNFVRIIGAIRNVLRAVHCRRQRWSKSISLTLLRPIISLGNAAREHRAIDERGPLNLRKILI